MDVAKILEFALENGASDIILSPGKPPGIRINGALRTAAVPALDGQHVEDAIRELVTDAEFEMFQSHRELDFAAMVSGERFRGNAYWRCDAPGLALRPIANKIASPEELGLPKLVVDLIKHPSGLVLFTGAAGQGKSTSQASLIDLINTNYEYHIVTIEDPIEFLHPSKRSFVDQREVGSDTLNFANALRHVMRQNPDVIQVGEMRDRETMQAVLTIAETGSLVFSTLHTNDACQAIDRIVDVFPESNQAQIRTQLSLALLAVVNQKLIPTKAGRRVMAAEVLLNVTAVANLIREGKTQQLYSMFDIDGSTHARSMNRALQDLVDDGHLEAHEAERHMLDRESRVVSRKFVS